MNTNLPMLKDGLRFTLASVLAALWLTACGGGDSAPAITALASPSSTGQFASQLPVAAETQTAPQVQPVAPAQTTLPTQVQVQVPPASPGSTEFRVNTTTAGRQENSSITRLKSGGHVIAWISSSELFDGISIPPNTQGMCTQSYGVNGTALGQETCIGDTLTVVDKPPFTNNYLASSK